MDDAAFGIDDWETPAELHRAAPDAMQWTPVDERDSTWEDAYPRFRVYVHTSDGSEPPSFWTMTYDLTGCDALQAIDWAQRTATNQGGGPWALALVIDREDPETHQPPRSGLVWLVGIDGNTTPVDDHERDILSRMRARTGERRVEVPEQDRATASPDGNG